MTPKKVMVTVWWSSTGVIHHNFLPNGMNITADMYCEELNTIMGKLARLQPALVNRSASLLHDNARSHTAQETVSKLQELGLEVLRHPPLNNEFTKSKTFMKQLVQLVNLNGVTRGSIKSSSNPVKSG
ncbi:histone-lysine N-methyltransferase SETMAR-like [Melitaea cinxia]|uniref:histone-lysine N-methyltransferase SETMAR-like n=1 Tax=Melitaea cinxia TaxID=113334 RepID=UPI001E273C0C|nr:histone-lysine N-methyltransferase SETMAR-like [Melitaea cinxia]